MAVPSPASDDGFISDSSFEGTSVNFASQFPEEEPVAGGPADKPSVAKKKNRKVNVFYVSFSLFRN